ncbi:Krueppel-like factor 13 [Nannospalax galili]|uniref:Krueppel-like factor 13 n=1 Tax=Nannospalax galili TaxID=1026970 RepID=UPI00111BF612|nr:Krueppel-like factor 13 [Nannospalax galili]
MPVSRSLPISESAKSQLAGVEDRELPETQRGSPVETSCLQLGVGYGDYLQTAAPGWRAAKHTCAIDRCINCNLFFFFCQKKYLKSSWNMKSRRFAGFFCIDITYEMQKREGKEKKKNHPHMPSADGRGKAREIPAGCMQAEGKPSAPSALPRDAATVSSQSASPKSSQRRPARPPTARLPLPQPPPPPPPLAPGAEQEPRANASARPASAGRAGSASSLGDGAAPVGPGAAQRPRVG